MAPSPTGSERSTTKVRLLEATRTAVAQYGPRKLSLTDVAALAGVSRHTLYRHFASKDDLLLALSVHEKERYEQGLATALHGLTGPARLDRALQYAVEYQRDDPLIQLVAIEPGFMLEQFEWSLRAMRGALVPLFEELAPSTGPDVATPTDLADLVVRICLSHYVMAGDDDEQLLRQLRHVAGLPKGATPDGVAPSLVAPS